MGTNKHRDTAEADTDLDETVDSEATDLSEADAPPLREYRPKRRLRTVVAAVSACVLSVWALTFLWLAWLMSGAAAPWAGGGFGWLPAVQPAHWLSAAVSATALALGLCATIFAALAVRRQDVTERAFDFNTAAHETALRQLEISEDAQHIAEWQAGLAQTQGELDRQRLVLETERLDLDRDLHVTARESALRKRFTDAAALLASEQIPVRMAGVYALASLADDWHDFGDDAARQMCVSLLCDQLRLAPAEQAEFEVHRSIVALIRSHRPTQETGDATWSDCVLDLSDAYIPTVNLIDTDLSGVTLSRANLSGASLANSTLDDVSAAYANFDRANMVSVTLRDADLRGATLTGCLMTGSELARADLRGAELSGSDFTKARFGTADVTGAVLDAVNLAEAGVDDVVFDATTQWPTSSGYPVAGS
ncbi:pentapeptide repeat-containing protein [Mycobacterium koreense]|uniref:Uncharacterized protein n=1 Tax=Mycolicibacillus koreensis TaxID=1069220 RepID=A0A7I7SAX4_9MYCO|nr:pentapeptide repeat-containing protein [Mycolicibacillus koreensis]MCV7247654.1 pentapeptide repeat-containing protein [Mycolicibacillus koreensis]OSC30611.1 hypothetical protein B8W67_16885 [Mycolicibacillus koreensis]BBY54037.1 hypothetical protein MKOR_12880 [Mycolicibacillus koreensis]